MSKINHFPHKDGFYELPYLVNSPQAMVESFKKMPFVEVNEAHQYISTKTPALDIVVYHRDIEKGLFLIYSKAEFKANVNFRHQFDKLKPANFYCLSLRIDHCHCAKVNNSMADGISYTDNSWLIFKPQAKVDHYYFGGTKGEYISVYFTPEWLKNCMEGLPIADSQLLKLFLTAGNDYLICPNLSGNIIYDDAKLSKLLKSGEAVDGIHLRRLKKEVLGFIASFIMKMRLENISEHHFKVSNLERIKVLKAEKIIRAHLYEKFPGITAIAQETGVSETKLKECFKAVYGKTVFRYFQGLQMDQARELILQTNLQIARIALKFCYEHPGKFSAAFKAHHGVSPSDTKGIRA
jgi:AraC-like DNA-binding protein